MDRVTYVMCLSTDLCLTWKHVSRLFQDTSLRVGVECRILFVSTERMSHPCSICDARSDWLCVYTTQIIVACSCAGRAITM